MSNQDWTSKLQDQLAGYQESVSHDLWAGIEQSLAQKNIESVSSDGLQLQQPWHYWE